MKNFHRAAAWSILSLAFIAQARAADLYTFDPAHTSIIFSAAHSGFSFTYGMFRKASGTYVIDKTNGANCRFRLNIDASSLYTSNDERDKHLRSADFFNVQQFPEIVFETTRCVRSDTQDGPIFQLTGNLTIHGVTKQVTVPLRQLGEGIGPYKDQRTGFICQFEIKRTDFGMKELLENGLVGDAVGITISFEGIMQPPGSAAQ